MIETTRDVILNVVDESRNHEVEVLAMSMSEDQIRAALKLGPRPKPQFGHNRSHAMNATKRQFKPNLQTRRVLVNGQEQKIKLTTREIRTLLKRGRMLLAE